METPSAFLQVQSRSATTAPVAFASVLKSFSLPLSQSVLLNFIPCPGFLEKNNDLLYRNLKEVTACATY